MRVLSVLRPGVLVIATLAVGAIANGAPAAPSPQIIAKMNEVAENYVKLVLALGTHDADYVDAFHGPVEWRTAIMASPLALTEIRQRERAARSVLKSLDLSGAEALVRLRHRFLDEQFSSMDARIDLLEGKALSFDEESAALYGAVAPTNSEDHFRHLLAELDLALPGNGALAERWQAFRREFFIPREKLDAVFQAAIAECRRRTARRMALPASEAFTVEYVTGTPWSAYNWYKGNFQSLIQVNTDLPITIDRALHLACHEGYPGHHVYNTLLEKHLLQERGWVEFSVHALFSPQSLMAEGTAEYGITVAFPDEERLAFERDVLYPLAGLDPARAAEYQRVRELMADLRYAENEAARRYLNGEIDAAGAASWLTQYKLEELAAAEKRVRFFDKYRSYVINYNLGEDLVTAYVEARAGGDVDRRWAVFKELISSPRLPSTLK